MTKLEFTGFVLFHSGQKMAYAGSTIGRNGVKTDGLLCNFTEWIKSVFTGTEKEKKPVLSTAGLVVKLDGDVLGLVVSGRPDRQTLSFQPDMGIRPLLDVAGANTLRDLASQSLFWILEFEI